MIVTMIVVIIIDVTISRLVGISVIVNLVNIIFVIIIIIYVSRRDVQRPILIPGPGSEVERGQGRVQLAGTKES